MLCIRSASAIAEQKQLVALTQYLYQNFARFGYLGDRFGITELVLLGHNRVFNQLAYPIFKTTFRIHCPSLLFRCCEDVRPLFIYEEISNPFGNEPFLCGRLPRKGARTIPAHARNLPEFRYL